MHRVRLLLLLYLVLIPMAGRAALLAWYPLDETAWNGSAGEIVDATGNGNGGRAVGNAVNVAGGRVCRGGRIPANTSDGVQDAIDTGIDVDNRLGRRGSISFWYQSRNGWRGNGDHMLLDASTRTDNKYFFLVLRDTGQLRFRFEDSRDRDFELEGSARNFPAGEWHHVAVTWDLPANRMEIYIDGARDASRSIRSTGLLGELGSLYIGDNRSSYHPRGTASSADGVFDEIRVHDTVLSASGVLADMNATHPCDGRIAEWRMEELGWSGNAGEVADELGAYPGVARNGALTASQTPALPGSPGSCRYGGFDGNDDYVELPGFPDLTGSFTITAWVRPDRVDKHQRIFADDYNNARGFAFSLGDGGDGRLRFFSRNVSPVVVDTQQAVVSPGQWSHVAVVHDAAAKTRRIYVNGVAVMLDNGSTTSIYSGNWGSDPGPAAIGGEVDGSTEATANWRFDGNIDEVRVYGAALDAPDIATIMNETHPCPLQPIAEYRFDECSYSGLLGEVEDSRGNYQATPLNGVNTNRPGVINGYLDENLRTHQVRADNNIPMNGAWTVSTWFRTPFVTTQRYHVLGAMEGGGDLLFLDRNSNFRWGVYVPGRVVYGSFRFGNLPDGWHHLALVGTNQGSRGETDLYIDGNYIERINLQARGNLHYIGTSFDFADGASTQGFGTAMDEFTVFDYALTPEEIRAIRSNQQNGLNVDGTFRPAVGCQRIDHFNINIGAGNASTCSPFVFSITAADSGNNPVTDYTGSVTISTSSGHGNFSVVSATNSLSPNPDNDDNGLVSYSFDAADNGQIDLSLENQRAETLTLSVSDSSIPLTSTSGDVVFRDNAFVIEDVDAAVSGDNVPVAGRDHAYRIRLMRRDPSSGICGIATAYQGNRPLKLWRVKNAADPSNIAPSLGGVSLPDSEPVAANATVGFTAGEALLSMSSGDIGKFTLEASDVSRSFADIDIAGGSAEQTVRPFGIGIDFGNLRDADFADNGSIDDSTGNDLSWAADAGGSVFTQAGENFSMTVTGALWQAVDDADNDGVPDGGAYLGDNAPAPSFGAEGETVVAEVSVNAPAGATAESLVVGGVAGGLFNAFSGGEQTADVRYGNVGIIDIQARLPDNDYFGSGVAITGSAPNVGRFNPWQYAVTTSSVTPACSSAGAFTYAREPFTAQLTLQAQNRSGGLTDGYRAGFVTLDIPNELNLVNDRTGMAYDLESYSIVEAFGSGIYGEARFTVRLAWNMPLQAPVTSRVQLIDTLDEVTRIAGSPFAVGETEIRFGRMALDNAHGSELLDLPVPMRAEYYDGANFLLNSDDGCSSFLPDRIVLDSAVESAQTDGDIQVLAGQVSRLTLANSPLSAGEAGLSLCPPGNPACTPTAGNEGWVDLRLDLGARPWLRFDWDGDGLHDDDPAARATFGIFRGNERQIHLRRLFD
jgi:MSHA biogenesis protein MshQ